MADARQFTPAATATSAACTQYLLRAGVDATQYSWRLQQLMGAVARHQLGPDVAAQAMETTAGWATIAQETAASFAEFAAVLARRPLLPVERAPAHETLDAPAPSSAARCTAFIATLESLSGPDVTNGARRRALTRLANADINTEVAEVATAWFAMLETVMSATLRTLNPALLAALRMAQPVGFDRSVIELEGAVATHASTTLEIENTLERAASLQCTVREVRRADGVGPAFTPACALSPERQLVPARAMGDVALTMWLDDAQFDPHAMYVGALCVQSDGGTTLDIPLRITTAPARQ